jgi:hypothetical protein
MKEPVYLGTQQSLLAFADDELAMREMRLLMHVLEKVGYRLASGVEPDFHQLWAIPIPPAEPAPADEPPRVSPLPTLAEFERRFLAWLHISYEILPEQHSGTGNYYWRFPLDGNTVEFAIVPRSYPPGLQARDSTDWWLRIEETEPARFIRSVEGYFEDGSGVRRRMSNGKTRLQFWSRKLIYLFDDQSTHT